MMPVFSITYNEPLLRAGGFWGEFLLTRSKLYPLTTSICKP